MRYGQVTAARRGEDGDWGVAVLNGDTGGVEVYVLVGLCRSVARWGIRCSRTRRLGRRGPCSIVRVLRMRRGFWSCCRVYAMGTKHSEIEHTSDIDIYWLHPSIEK